MSPYNPKSVGSCKIEDLIGKGGMAEVFLGVQESLERKVAVKALLRELKEDAEATERFRREALALATLQHENIVAVHDLIEKYNRLYIIMEYVDGVDLATVLDEGPVPIDIGLIIGSELASALEHAHFRKVLHRDIKPANVMLSRTGQVKLTDFGIAKDQTRDDLTREGFVVGTPRYLSPEQVVGDRADWRSDIYSLGVLLYESLTGTKAYRGTNQAEIMVAVAKGQRRSLRERAPHLPRALEKIIDRCMKLDPHKRYQRATELRRDLDRLLAAVLKGNPAARMVAFLKERGQVEPDDLTLLASDEVAAVETVSKPSTVLSRMRVEINVVPPSYARRVGKALLVVLLVLICLSGAAAATWLLAPDKVQQAIAEVNVWIERSRRELREEIPPVAGDEQPPSPRGGG